MYRKKRIVSFLAIMMLTVTTIVVVPPTPVKATPPSGVPTYLQVGDILFCECQDQGSGHALPGWDHVSIYIGGNQFIEAVPNEGVWVTNLNIYHTWATDITYGYVTTASASQKQAAVAFSYGQLGKPYQPFPDRLKDPSPDSPAWYCSELVWAAYYNQGIDIDGDGGLAVWPQDIADDNEVQMYADQPPSRPTRPSGPTSVYRFTTRIYSTSAVDPEGEDLYYQWDWGESLDAWYLIPRDSGSVVLQPHTWLTLGTHLVKVRAKDLAGNIGPWSDPLTVTVRKRFGGGSYEIAISDISISEISTIDASISETGYYQEGQG